MSEEAKVTIFRFDPTVDRESRYETYQLPPEGWKNLTVLETLRWIYRHLDPGLSFRESCRVKMVCSACMLRLNKKAILACDTPSVREMLLEPAPNRPLIKDLVVSFNSEKSQLQR